MTPAAFVMLTVGKIADHLGVPLHRVEYVLRTRPIRPKGWAGNARVYDEDAVTTIRAALKLDRGPDDTGVGSHAAR